MSSNALATRQPGKLIYTLYSLLVNLTRFPLLLIYYIPYFTRPNPQWTYRQALGIRIVKSFLYWQSVTELTPPMKLTPGPEGSKFVQIKPAKPERYIGAVAQDPEIKAATIGATWYPKVPTAANAGKIIIHCHGGGYAIGDGRKKDAGFAAKTLLKNASADHVLCPQYRLASLPGGRFPAPLQDAITSLLYVHETLNVPAERIIISGDSAGAHLCLSLLRYIHDSPDAKLPNPKAAFLWSPWVDPFAIIKDPGSFYLSPRKDTDYINPVFPTWGASSFAPSKASGLATTHPNVTILGNPFPTPTHLWFQGGSSELLFDDILKVHEEFTAIPGNKTQLEITENAVHDIILIGHIVGFEKEAADCAKRADGFVKSLL